MIKPRNTAHIVAHCLWLATLAITTVAANSTPSTPQGFDTAHSVPVGFSYRTNPLTLTAGTAMKSDSPAVTGTVTRYAVTPDLPAGLHLDAATGVVSGTTTFNSIAGYTITAGNASGSMALVLSIGVMSPAMIVSNPSNQTVTAHDPASFFVKASGTPSLFAYQWTRNGNEILTDGIGIRGATTDTLTFLNPDASDNGSILTCIAANSGGQIQSAGATLFVSGSPKPYSTALVHTDKSKNGSRWISPRSDANPALIFRDLDGRRSRGNPISTGIYVSQTQNQNQSRD